MPIKKKLQWVDIPALPGERTNKKIKGMVGAVAGETPHKILYSFTKDGQYFRGDYLRDIEVKPIKPPVWSKGIIAIETPGIFMSALFNTNKGLIYDTLNDPYSLRGVIKDANTYLRFLKKLESFS